LSAAILVIAFQAAGAQGQNAPLALEGVLRANEVTILADVKHGVSDRVAFFSSVALFEAMARADVRHVAIEMPRVLGHQAMGVETASDIEVFAQDIIRSGRWHFVDPDNPDEESVATQHRVASALGRQVLLARQFGINAIFYDFNNPLGGFRTYNDPVYRCLAELSGVVWLKYGLDSKITKSQRDAAIMRERFSHDDELAAYIASEVDAKGGGKLVVMPGYAHAVIPGGIADRIEKRLNAQATIVAVFRDEAEDKAFHSFLWEQSRLLSIDLSRPPHFYYTIAGNMVRSDDAPGRYVALDGSRERSIPSVCYQIAQTD